MSFVNFPLHPTASLSSCKEILIISGGLVIRNQENHFNISLTISVLSSFSHNTRTLVNTEWMDADFSCPPRECKIFLFHKNCPVVIEQFSFVYLSPIFSCVEAIRCAGLEAIQTRQALICTSMYLFPFIHTYVSILFPTPFCLYC